MATVDVLVPTYNRPAMLRQCLESIRTQTFTDIRVIIGDDGIDDRTRIVAQDFCSIDSRFHYVHNVARLGIFGNTNALFTQVTAPYTHFMHDDDWLDSRFYECMVAGLERTPEAALAWPGVLVVSQDGSERELALPSGLDHDQELPAQVAFAELVQRNFITCPAVVLRTSVLREVGPFAEYLTADRLMWMRIALRHDLEFISAPLFHHRSHEGQASADGVRMGEDVIDMLQFASGLDEFAGKQAEIALTRFQAVCTYIMEVKEGPQAYSSIRELTSYFLRHVPDHHYAMRRVTALAFAYTVIPPWLRPRKGGTVRRWIAHVALR